MNAAEILNYMIQTKKTVFKWHLLCFSLLSIIYIMLQCWMFILNMVKVSNNEVNVYRCNPREQSTTETGEGSGSRPIRTE